MPRSSSALPAALLGLPCHDAPRGAGLDAHHADVVGDDVVQLARDPYALLEHRPAGVLLALALELGRLRGEFALPVPQRADRDPEQQRKGDEADVVREIEALVQRQPVERPPL